MTDQFQEDDFEEFEDLGSGTLTIDDGTEGDYEILAIYPAGERQYIALRPEGSEGLDEVYLYRYIFNGEEEDPDIENIDDDDEYEIAADAFDELLDDADFEEE